MKWFFSDWSWRVWRLYISWLLAACLWGAVLLNYRFTIGTPIGLAIGILVAQLFYLADEWMKKKVTQ